MSSKTILIGLGFFGVVGKNPSMEDLPRDSLRTTVVHKALKILLRGVNLCRQECRFNDRPGECEVVRFTTPFFVLDKAKAL